jgi:uncharacterized membrane protein YgcG
MPTLNGASLTNLIPDTNLTATIAEYILDMAIHCLNLFGAEEMSTLSGTAGSKTRNVTTKEYGAILLVANQIYMSFYKGGGGSGSGGSSGHSWSLSGVSYSESTSSAITSNLMNNPEVLAAVKEASKQLMEIDVSYG